MSMLRNYFGFGTKQSAAAQTIAEPKKEEPKSAVRALPALWYTSPEMYELERRSVFSRKWLLMTHKLRLKEPNHWLRYSLAGFDFLLLGSNNNITACHNFCKQCAYPFVQSDDTHGATDSLACTCYKSDSNLIPVHVHLDNNGFIWVNFDSKDKTEVAWEEDLEGVDRQSRHVEFCFDDYEFDHTWGLEANYNWKIAADNYNECYHCKTTHPDLSSLANLEAYNVQPKAGHILHDVATTPEQLARGMRVTPTYFFPNSSMNVMSHFLFIQRFMPTGPTTTRVQYEVFRNKNSTEENFQLVNQMYKRVMSEDKVLCNLAQKNLNAGVFISGELHPRMERGPLFFQSKLRETVMEHFKREKETGHEIWPAKLEISTATLTAGAPVNDYKDDAIGHAPAQDVVVF